MADFSMMDMLDIAEELERGLLKLRRMLTKQKRKLRREHSKVYFCEMRLKNSIEDGNYGLVPLHRRQLRQAYQKVARCEHQIETIKEARKLVRARLDRLDEW